MPESITQGAPAEYAARIFNAELEELTATFDAGVTVLEALSGDPERVFLSMTNLSVNDVYVSSLNTVSSTIGIRLASNGGSLILNAKDDFILTTFPYFVLGAAANSLLTITTMRRFQEIISE